LSLIGIICVPSLISPFAAPVRPANILRRRSSLHYLNEAPKDDTWAKD